MEYFRLKSGGGNWGAVLSADVLGARPFVEAMNHRRNPSTYQGDFAAVFELVGRRTFTPNYEDYPNRSQEEAIAAFDREYPYGKTIQPADGSAFKPILAWESYSMHENTYVEAPRKTQNYRLISEEMASILKGAQLPKHQFTPILVKHAATKEEKPYQLLHLHCGRWWLYQQCNWLKMVPIAIDNSNGNALKRFAQGEDGTFDAFIQKKSSYFQAHADRQFAVEYYALKNPLDVLPIGIYLYVSAPLADKLSMAGFEEVIGEQYQGTPIVL